MVKGYLDPEAEAGYCIEQIRARVPWGPVRRYGGVAAYKRPVLMRDASAEHQPVIEHPAGGGISLSCNCRYQSGRGGGYYEPLEVRRQWPPAEIIRVYHEHLKAAGMSPAHGTKEPPTEREG